MSVDPAELDGLLARARAGESEARAELLARHQELLRRSISLRLDRRVRQRVDVSDVLQETCFEASRRLTDYLARRPMPFHLWLLWLARERVLAAHRQHLGTEKRDVRHESPLLPQDSSAAFVSGLLGAGPTPSQNVAQAELAERLRQAIAQLDDDEREIILWRHFEVLTNQEVAQLLEISTAAASKRYVRALEQLRGLLERMGVNASASRGA